MAVDRQRQRRLTTDQAAPPRPPPQAAINMRSDQPQLVGRQDSLLAHVIPIAMPRFFRNHVAGRGYTVCNPAEISTHLVILAIVQL